MGDSSVIPLRWEASTDLTSTLLSPLNLQSHNTELLARILTFSSHHVPLVPVPIQWPTRTITCTSLCQICKM